jgi:hypothetical protein
MAELFFLNSSSVRISQAVLLAGVAHRGRGGEMCSISDELKELFKFVSCVEEPVINN